MIGLNIPDLKSNQTKRKKHLYNHLGKKIDTIIQALVTSFILRFETLISSFNWGGVKQTK